MDGRVKPGHDAADRGDSLTFHETFHHALLPRARLLQRLPHLRPSGLGAFLVLPAVPATLRTPAITRCAGLTAPPFSPRDVRQQGLVDVRDGRVGSSFWNSVVVMPKVRAV